MPNELIIRNKAQRLLMFKALITERRDGFIVDGESLQDALENSLQYSKWIKRKIEQNNLIEGEDYLVYNSNTQKVKENQILDKTVLQVSYGGSNKLAYSLTVKATQRIAGKDRSEVGYELLDYLFDLSEKQLIKTPTNFIEALKALVASEEDKLKLKEDKEKLKMMNEEKQLLIEEQKPKVDFFDTVAKSVNGIVLNEAAKVLNLVNKNGKTLGPNHLFKFLREQGYLRDNNTPYKKYIDRDYFRLIQKEYTKGTGDDAVTKTYTQTLIYPKGIEKVRKLLVELNCQPKEEYLKTKAVNKEEERLATRKITFTQLIKELNMNTPSGRTLKKRDLINLLKREGIAKDTKYFTPEDEYFSSFLIKATKYSKDGNFHNYDKTFILASGVKLITELLIEKGYTKKEK